MATVRCLQPGCPETMELPGDEPIARATPDYRSRDPQPEQREVELVCPRGHLSIFHVPSG
jgi:hypothetical protein